MKSTRGATFARWEARAAGPDPVAVAGALAGVAVDQGQAWEAAAEWVEEQAGEPGD